MTKNKDETVHDLGDVTNRPKSGDLQNTRVVKQMPVETRVVDESRRVIRFTASTGAIDRDQDTLNPMGWDISEYIKNPVVQWCHDYTSPPAGKCVNAFVENGRLVEDVQFVDPFELFPDKSYSEMPEWVKFVDMVYQMYKNGYLSAVSVGFEPVEYTYVEARGGFDFKRMKQLELSLVPVPSNPEALQEAGMKGANGILKKWAKKTLDTIAEGGDTMAKESKSVIVEKRSLDVWVCPHCNKEIGEKSLYQDEGVMIHGICGGALILPDTKGADQTGTNQLNSELLSAIKSLTAKVDELGAKMSDGKGNDEEDIIDISDEDIEKAIKAAIWKTTGKIL